MPPRYHVYSCKEHRLQHVRRLTPDAAAEVFARRIARRLYGHTGHCKAVRDHGNNNFEALIGRETSPTGRAPAIHTTIWLTIQQEK